MTTTHRRTARALRCALLTTALLLIGCTGAAQTSRGATSSAPAEADLALNSSPAVVTDPADSATASAPVTAGKLDSGPAPTPPIAATSTTQCNPGPCYLPPMDLGFLTDALAPEVSGIAADSTDPDLFFVVDDATGTDKLVAINGSGQARATIEVSGLRARNAESLATGVCGDPSRRCLYIGDIGDNGLRRETITVVRTAEPVVPPATVGSVALLGPLASESWEFSYPDGPRNAEAMLTGEDGSVIIITKPDRGASPHEIYRGAPGGGELLLVNSFTPPKALKPLQSIIVGTVVTDASRLPDRVILLTYDQAIEYLAPTPDADPAMFSQWPFRQLPIPEQWQSEGISYLASAGLAACGFIVVSEKGGGNHAQLGRVDCRES